MKTETLFLMPNERQSVQVEGNYMRLHKGEASIRVTSGGVVDEVMEQGDWFREEGHHIGTAIIENLSGEEQTIVIKHGTGEAGSVAEGQIVDIDEVRKAVKVHIEESIDLKVNLIIPDSVNPLPDVVVPAGGKFKLCDQNNARKELIASLPLDIVEAVRIADTNVAANKGAKYYAGTGVISAAKGELWAYNHNTQDVVIALSEVVGNAI